VGSGSDVYYGEFHSLNFMNKKIVVAALLTSVVGIVVWLLVQSYQTLQHKKEIETKMQQLPTISLRGLDSTGVTLTQKSQPTVLFYFDPHCEHCQHEATELKKQSQDFKNAQLLWLSTERLWVLRAFEKEYGLQKKIPSLTIAQISPQEAAQQFGFRTVPTILIYDAEGNLAKKYVGETKMDAIIKYLNR
jgi:protein-disulfide isomerase